MNHTISRRDFLKLSALSLGALAARPLGSRLIPLPPEKSSRREMLGRVTRRYIHAYSQPDLESKRVRKIQRDTILYLLEEIDSPYGPRHNPRWYQLASGFVHSAYIQRVEQAHLNAPLASIPESGQLGEITVPYSLATYKSRRGEWMSLYRLYYGSLHWITGVSESPEGEPWYNLTDERLKVQYFVPAVHVRPIHSDELAPLSPHVPPGRKRIEVSLEAQVLTAYEGNKVVLETEVATGRRYMETPEGEFYINRKTPSKHMGDGALTSDLHAYELVGVPWVSFFHTNGVAFHGTFWHDNFATPISHGCVNMRNSDAKWLFRWCTPPYDPFIENRRNWKVRGKGTFVRVY